MNTRNKIRLANVTTWIMVTTISIIAIWFVGYAVITTFALNVFTKNTSGFITTFLGFSVVLVLCSAILNISLNIGLIADKQIQDIKKEVNIRVKRKPLLLAFSGIGMLIAFLFLGDYLSRKNEKDQIQSAASYMVATYAESVNKISSNIEDTSMTVMTSKILEFLSSQKAEFPSVSVIASDTFDRQLAFLEISSRGYNRSKREFYACQSYDCDYLQGFFTGKIDNQLVLIDKNDYKLYYPVINNGVRYILLFKKYESHGKIGMRYSSGDVQN